MKDLKRPLYIIAVVLVIQLFSPFILAGFLSKQLDQTENYNKGFMDCRSKSHSFILHRISPDAAGKYIDWMASK